ncbi:MAG: hypothetical protein N2572_01250 [Syntrophales bacterium]|nr:hypothetical protein [Syntrophales bacterium]
MRRICSILLAISFVVVAAFFNPAEAVKNVESKKTSPITTGKVWSWQSSHEGSVLFSVKETSDGGYIAVGNAHGDGTPDKPHGVYMIKLNKGGVKIWDRWWGRTDIVGDAHMGYDVVEADDGGYVLTGQMEGDDYIGRLVVIKVDARGTILWQQAKAAPLGRGFYACGFSIQKSPDKGFLISGTVSYPFVSIGRSGSLTFPYVMKIDNSGNILWEKYYWEQHPPKGSLNEKGEYVFTDDGRVNNVQAGSHIKNNEVLAARAKSRGYFLAFTNRLNVARDRHMSKLMRIDENGNVVWEKSIHKDIGLDVFVFGISETADDGVIITGYTRTRNLKWQGEYEVGYLIKFDADGNQQWKRYFGDTTLGRSSVASDFIEPRPNYIRQTSDGGYIVSGYTSFSRMILMKFDKNGNIMWDRVIAGRYNYAFCTQQTSDGGFITAGSKFSSQYKNYNYFALLMKSDMVGNIKEKYTAKRICVLE